MLGIVESALNGVRMTPCPGCGDRALVVPAGAVSPCVATCASCDHRWDALAEVTVVRDGRRMLGNCCSGFRRHELEWQQGPEHPVQTTKFQTWAQEHPLLRPGDVVSLLFNAGDLDPGAGARRRPRAPLMVANHTLPGVWALAGSVPVATLR